MRADSIHIWYQKLTILCNRYLKGSFIDLKSNELVYKMSDEEINNEKIRQVIKDMLKERALTHADLAKSLRVSQATVKRMLNSNDLSVGKMTQIAKILGIDFFELVRVADEFKVAGVQMTEDQEYFLAEDPARTHVLWRLTNGFSPATIAKDGNASLETVVSHLKMLVGMNLVEKTGDTFRAKVSWPFGFRFKGPLHQKFTKKN